MQRPGGTRKWPIDADKRFNFIRKTLTGGGGGTPLYKPYRYVPPLVVGFFGRFGLKMGIDFAHFGLESGMIFEETTVVYERIFKI